MIRYSVEKLMSQMTPTLMAQDVLFCSGPLAHLQFFFKVENKIIVRTILYLPLTT